MTTNANAHAEGSGHHEEGFPWHHIIGFVVSIVLTLVALWMVMQHVFPPAGLMTAILVLAAAQIAIQLFFFMHITESYGPRYHVMTLTIGLCFVIAVVAGSIWVMSFGSTQAY